jgi:hypothetical protein
MMRGLSLVSVALLFVVSHSVDYFSSLEEIMKSEKAKYGSDALHSEFASDKPKEIEIVCSETPQVLIRDMMDAADNTEECMVLKVSGPKFSFRFAVNCDEDNEAPGFEEEGDNGEIEVEEEEEEQMEEVKVNINRKPGQGPASRATPRPTPKPSALPRDSGKKVHME